jgi:AraC family ethanolamine operon transcriptional activator
MRLHRLAVRNVENLELATGGDREFRPTQIGPGEVTGRLRLSEFGGIKLTYGSFRCDIHVSGTLSNNMVTLGLLLPGTRKAELFGKNARPGDLLVVGEGRDNDARYRSRLRYICVNVEKAHLLRINAVEGLGVPPGMLDGSDVVELERAKATHLVKRITTISNTVQSGSLRTIGPEAEQWLADEIVFEFGRCLSDATSKGRTGTRPRRGLPRLVKRAEDWLVADPSRRPNVEELSRVLAVSPRQLFRAFSAEVGTSPVHYLKQCRMTQARLDLERAEPEATTVTRVANSWGFWELGRFAVEYRQLFGEYPSQTLRHCAAFRGKRRSATSRSMGTHAS